MTQRHKKSNSKFSKNANMNNPETKSAVEEQLRLKEQLNKKMLSLEEEEEGENEGKENEFDSDPHEGFTCSTFDDLQEMNLL